METHRESIQLNETTHSNSKSPTRTSKNQAGNKSNKNLSWVQEKEKETEGRNEIKTKTNMRKMLCVCRL